MNRTAISLILSFFIFLLIGCVQSKQGESESGANEEPIIEGPAFVLFYTEN